MRRAFPIALLLALLPIMAAGGCLPAPLPGDRGAAGRLDDDETLADFERLASPDLAGRMTGSDGGEEARRYIADAFAHAGLSPAVASGFEQPFHFTDWSPLGLVQPWRSYGASYSGANVLAVARGTETPDEVLVVSAHLDHLGTHGGEIYCGADDNASGVAALLSLARHFGRHPPKHTLLFAAFDAEELGLAGSRHFLAHLPVKRDAIVLDVNMDMISRPTQQRLFIAGTSETPTLLPYVERAARRSAISVLLGHDSALDTLRGMRDWSSASDHGAFDEEGIPFLYLGVESHPDYHEPGDTFARADQAFFLEATALALNLMIELDAGR